MRAAEIEPAGRTGGGFVMADLALMFIVGFGFGAIVGFFVARMKGADGH